MPHAHTDQPMTAEERDIRRDSFNVELASSSPAQLLDFITGRCGLSNLTSEDRREVKQAKSELMARLRADPPTALKREQIWLDSIGRVLMVTEHESIVICLGDGLRYPAPTRGGQQTGPADDWTYLGPTLKLALWGSATEIEEALSIIGAARSLNPEKFEPLMEWAAPKD